MVPPRVAHPREGAGQLARPLLSQRTFRWFSGRLRKKREAKRARLTTARAWGIRLVSVRNLPSEGAFRQIHVVRHTRLRLIGPSSTVAQPGVKNLQKSRWSETKSIPSARNSSSAFTSVLEQVTKLYVSVTKSWHCESTLPTNWRATRSAIRSLTHDCGRMNPGALQPDPPKDSIFPCMYCAG